MRGLTYSEHLVLLSHHQLGYFGVFFQLIFVDLELFLRFVPLQHAFERKSSLKHNVKWYWQVFVDRAFSWGAWQTYLSHWNWLDLELETFDCSNQFCNG